MTVPAAGLTAKGTATRARLLAAAGAELAENGSCELARVAARAGIAQSALYRYFPGKDGLVEAVVHDFYDQYGAEVFDLPAGPAMPGATWMQREELRIAREVAFLYGHPLGRVVAAGLIHEAAATRADAIRLREQAAAAARNIRHGQKSGELSRDVDAGLAGAALIGSLRTMLAEALSREAPPPQRKVVDAVVAMGAALLTPARPTHRVRKRASRPR